MYPREFAQTTPVKAALIFEPSGIRMSYRELEERANQCAQFFRAKGIVKGDKVAFALENCVDVFPFAWGAQRAGLLFVPISSRLTAEEIAYIVSDSGATLLLTSDQVLATSPNIAEAVTDAVLYKTGEAQPGFLSWDVAIAEQPIVPIADEFPGLDMLYSSGTTGRPKGIVRQMPDDPRLDAPNAMAAAVDFLLGGLGSRTVYLSPAPLYHAAPLSGTMAVHRLGGTVVVLEKFDPELVLQTIDKHQVTSVQFVPTHFGRLLRLPEHVKGQYNYDTLVSVVHAAAPCPIPIKEAMIAWWGEIITEYYGGSEGAGLTIISSPEWLQKKGSVGRAVGCVIHICDDDGVEQGARGEGHVFFESDAVFHYHNDAAKSAEAVHAEGWRTFGDIGWVDEDGYLFLTDRKSFMIISGGVNIYPQEIENLLATHPKVADAAVIGAPDPDMGEKVVAVIQPVDWSQAGEELAEELTVFCRANLSGVKLPRQIDFVEELPRMPTGKLFKRLVRDAYWPSKDEQTAPAAVRASA